MVSESFFVAGEVVAPLIAEPREASSDIAAKRPAATSPHEDGHQRDHVQAHRCKPADEADATWRVSGFVVASTGTLSADHARGSRQNGSSALVLIHAAPMVRGG